MQPLCARPCGKADRRDLLAKQARRIDSRIKCRVYALCNRVPCPARHLTLNKSTYDDGCNRIEKIFENFCKTIGILCLTQYDHAWPHESCATFSLGYFTGVARELSRISRCFPDFSPHFVWLWLYHGHHSGCIFYSRPHVSRLQANEVAGHFRPLCSLIVRSNTHLTFLREYAHELELFRRG